MTTAYSTRNNQRSKIKIVSKSCGKGKTSQPSPRSNKPHDLLDKFVYSRDTTAHPEPLIEINKLLIKKNININPEILIQSRQDRKITRINFFFQTNNCKPSIDYFTQPSTPINKLIDLENFR